VRVGRLRADSVPGTADALRQAAAAAAVSAHRVGAGHRAAVLRATCRQDADRHADTRHASERRLVQLAVHVRSVELYVVIPYSCDLYCNHAPAMFHHTVWSVITTHKLTPTVT